MSEPPQPRSWRREAGAILGLTALGAALRLWVAPRLGLCHFDEGVYAAAGLWPFAPNGLKDLPPTVIYYAPVGLPILIGLSYLVLGVSDIAAIAASLVPGILTIPVAAWLGRRTFGPGAGAAAAAFAAVSGPHVALSRMAMTDVPLVLVWLVAVGLGARFLERPALGRAVLLGLAVGVAQSVKYNGWLTGAIVALTAVLGVVLGAVERKRAVRVFGLGALAAVIALAVYGPWLQFVEGQVGYRSLLEHQRSYLGRVASWPNHWVTQLNQTVALSGGAAWGALAWVLACLGARFSTADGFPVKQPWWWLPSVLVLGAVVLGLLPQLAWWTGLGLLPWLLRDQRPGNRMLGVWWLVLSILTPFYYPYARLWLPLHAVGWLVLAKVAWFLATIEPAAVVRDDSRPGPHSLSGARGSHPQPRGRDARAPRRPSPQPRRRGARVFSQLFGPRWDVAERIERVPQMVVGWGMVILLLALAQILWSPERARPLPGLLAPSDDLRRVCDEVVREVPETVLALRALVRPPVTFYLGGRLPTVAEPDLERLLGPGDPRVWALVDEVQLRQEGDPQRTLSRLLERWEMVRSWPTRLNLPTLLDVDPGAALTAAPDPMVRIWLLRPRTSGVSP